MSTIVRVPLSAAPDGQPICIAKVATLGNAVHSAAGGSTLDYITLRACNNATTQQLLTMEKGGTADGKVTKVNIPAQVGWVTVLDRALIGSSLVLTAFAASSSVINLDGFVDRVS